MTRIQTPISGISTTSTYEEGSAYSLVNLRPKNGALHPVSPRKIMQELSQNYDIVFVHHNNDYKNWIGVINNDNNSSVYWDIRDDQPQNIASFIQGPVNSIQQIGNTLSLITDDNIYYLLYHDGKYTFLGELPQVPVISFGTSDNMSRATCYYASEYGRGTITPDNFIDATKGLVNKAIKILVEGDIDSEGNPIGGYGMQFFDSHFIRYGYRLYDNTIVKQSPPILMLPVKNILDIKTIRYKFENGSLDDNVSGSNVTVYGYRAYMSYDFTDLDLTKWKDIIKSIDIFISQPVGISNIENMRRDLSTKNGDWIDANLIKEITPEASKNVTNTSNFYLLRSILLDTFADPLNPSELPARDNTDEISKLENLIFQEEMPDDNFSNHKYGAPVSYAYNGRLHLGNIKTTFFNGFSPGYFQWANSYNGVTPPSGSVNTLVAEVDIYTGTSLEKVYSFFSTYATAPKLFLSAFISYPDTRAQRITFYEITDGVWTKVFTTLLESHNLLNLAYYLNNGLMPIVGSNLGTVTTPDTSKTITSYEPNKIKVSELNNPLNFPNLNTYHVSSGTILNLATNAMLVSDRNKGQYPLYVFTTQGVWSLNVGSNEVAYNTVSDPTYTEAPTTSIVGETPFGVVFTTQQGLRIINGQSVQFISPQLEQDYLNIKMELPEAQCKDVVLLYNDKSFKEYLKEIENIIYNPYESELIICDRDSEYNYILNFASQSFYKSTERITSMVNNVYPQLLVIDESKLKDYVSSNSPDTHVCLVLRPLIYGTPDIKRLERIILRGILVNIQNVSEGKKSVIMVHHSNDGINFHATRGLTSNPCNRSDYDMGLFASSKFRKFIFTFAGIIDESSTINFLDTEVSQEYNNTKMR